MAWWVELGFGGSESQCGPLSGLLASEPCVRSEVLGGAEETREVGSGCPVPGAALEGARLRLHRAVPTHLLN